MRATTRDGGQAAVALLLITVGLFAATSVAVATLGGHAIDRTRAQTAADAAALGSLDGGRAVAERLAARHGAVVVEWSPGPGPFDVTVVVRIGEVTARARATDAP